MLVSSKATTAQRKALVEHFEQGWGLPIYSDAGWFWT